MEGAWPRRTWTLKSFAFLFFTLNRRSALWLVQWKQCDSEPQQLASSPRVIIKWFRDPAQATICLLSFQWLRKCLTQPPQEVAVRTKGNTVCARPFGRTYRKMTQIGSLWKCTIRKSSFGPMLPTWPLLQRQTRWTVSQVFFLKSSSFMGTFTHTDLQHKHYCDFIPLVGHIQIYLSLLKYDCIPQKTGPLLLKHSPFTDIFFP